MIVDWETKKWDDVLEIRSGRSQKDVENPDGKYPIYGSGGTIMNYADDYLCEEGTTIIGRKGTIDNPLYIETKFWNVDTAFGLIAGEELDNRFLYYFCLSFDFSSRDKGTTLPSLVKKDLKKINIPIPPLPEQKRIVKILDEAFEAIDQAKTNIERNIENAEELFQSRLNEIFSQRGEGWEEMPLKKVCELLNGRAYKKKELLDDGKYVVLRFGNLFTNNTYYYSNLELDSDKYIDNGDLIYAWSASFGPRIWQGDKVIYHYHIWKVEINDELITKKFLYQLFDWDKEKIKAEQGTGTTMTHVSKRSMEKRILPIPPRDQQNKIADEISEYRRIKNSIIEIYEQKLSDLEELKKSILQKAFSGELTANEHVAA